jgi:hypothetical protein
MRNESRTDVVNTLKMAFCLMMGIHADAMQREVC